MYRTSTFFIKAQTPGIGIPVLLDLYRQELEYQEANDVIIHTKSINFSNKLFKLTWNQLGGQYANFSGGQIVIEEKEREFVVTLWADLTRLMERAGILAGIIMLLIAVSGTFHESLILFGLIVFVVLTGIFYLQILIFFPVYFTSLRNQIEEALQKHRDWQR